jgi:hypothetical protein
MACGREAGVSDEPEESTFSKFVRRTFLFLGALVVAAFLVFGVCTLVVMS